MKTLPTCCALLLAIFSVTANTLADTFGSGANEFQIEFVTIGNPGNAADKTGNPDPAGAVDHAYRIGKFEVSREMIEKANVAGGLGIRMSSMDRVDGGPRPAMPATDVSWNEAARFVNWLNTSKGFSVAYKFASQPWDVGYFSNDDILLWEPADAGYDAANLFRNSQAHYFLPSTDEWYKAAFYDPNANGGAGGYWDYPTGSDSVPTAVASGTDEGTVVWDQPLQQGPADITLAGGLSPYGVMGQAGNVFEWEETEFDLMNDNPSSSRGMRVSYWFTPFDSELSASSRGVNEPGTPPLGTDERQGFRVASVPEPSTLLLVALGTLGSLLWRRSSS